MSEQTANLILDLQFLSTLAERRAAVIEAETKAKEGTKEYSEKMAEYFLNADLTQHANYIIKYIAFYGSAKDKPKV